MLCADLNIAKAGRYFLFLLILFRFGLCWATFIWKKAIWKNIDCKKKYALFSFIFCYLFECFVNKIYQISLNFMVKHNPKVIMDSVESMQIKYNWFLSAVGIPDSCMQNKKKRVLRRIFSSSCKQRRQSLLFASVSAPLLWLTVTLKKRSNVKQQQTQYTYVCALAYTRLCVIYALFCYMSSICPPNDANKEKKTTH